MVKSRTFCATIAVLVIFMIVLFHLYQVLAAYAVLQGFWYIQSDDGADYYMLIEDETIQIVEAAVDSTTIIVNEPVSISCRPNLSMGMFSFRITREVDTPIPILGANATKKLVVDLHTACGILDIGTHESKARLVKDNAMTISYNMN